MVRDQVVRVAQVLAVPRPELDAPFLCRAEYLENLLDDTVFAFLRMNVARVLQQ